MNYMLVDSDRRNCSLRLLKSGVVAIVALALGFALWTATVPMAMAQNMTPAAMVEENLQGKTVANASKADLLSAICAAVKKHPKSAPQIANMAAAARPDLAKDILRTVFRCLGNGDCGVLGRRLRGVIAAVPNQASGLTTLAIELSPDCASSFPGPGVPGDEGNFGNVPVNQNPPPGSIAGGGGQSNVVAVCFNGTTQFFTPEGAENFLNSHPGASLGACTMTPESNQ